MTQNSQKQTEKPPQATHPKALEFAVPFPPARGTVIRDARGIYWTVVAADDDAEVVVIEFERTYPEKI